MLQIVLDATADAFDEHSQALDRLLATLTPPGGASAIEATASANQTALEGIVNAATPDVASSTAATPAAAASPTPSPPLGEATPVAQGRLSRR